MRRRFGREPDSRKQQPGDDEKSQTECRDDVAESEHPGRDPDAGHDDQYAGDEQRAIDGFGVVLYRHG